MTIQQFGLFVLLLALWLLMTAMALPRGPLAGCLVIGGAIFGLYGVVAVLKKAGGA